MQGSKIYDSCLNRQNQQQHLTLLGWVQQGWLPKNSIGPVVMHRKPEQ